VKLLLGATGNELMTRLANAGMPTEFARGISSPDGLASIEVAAPGRR